MVVDTLVYNRHLHYRVTPSEEPTNVVVSLPYEHIVVRNLFCVTHADGDIAPYIGPLPSIDCDGRRRAATSPATSEDKRVGQSLNNSSFLQPPYQLYVSHEHPFENRVCLEELFLLTKPGQYTISVVSPGPTGSTPQHMILNGKPTTFYHELRPAKNHPLGGIFSEQHHAPFSDLLKNAPTASLSRASFHNSNSGSTGLDTTPYFRLGSHKIYRVLDDRGVFSHIDGLYRPRRPPQEDQAVLSTAQEKSSPRGGSSAHDASDTVGGSEGTTTSTASFSLGMVHQFSPEYLSARRKLENATITADDLFRVAMEKDIDLHNIFYRDMKNDPDQKMLSAYRRFVRCVMKHCFPNERWMLYQAMPNVRFHLPGTATVPPHRDMDVGEDRTPHPPGEQNFLYTLSDARGSSAVIMESYPGLGDWHFLESGEKELLHFYGNRCVHLNIANVEERTRVSIDFRCITLTDYLNHQKLLKTRANPQRSVYSIVLGSYYEMMRLGGEVIPRTLLPPLGNLQNYLGERAFGRVTEEAFDETSGRALWGGQGAGAASGGVGEQFRGMTTVEEAAGFQPESVHLRLRREVGELLRPRTTSFAGIKGTSAAVSSSTLGGGPSTTGAVFPVAGEAVGLATLLRAGLRLRPGAQVLVSSFRGGGGEWVAEACRFAALKPVFCDVSEKTLGLVPETVREALDESSSSCKAVIYVWHNGRGADSVLSLAEFCGERGLALIEIAVVGSTWQRVEEDRNAAVEEFPSDEGLRRFRSFENGTIRSTGAAASAGAPNYRVTSIHGGTLGSAGLLTLGDHAAGAGAILVTTSEKVAMRLRAVLGTSDNEGLRMNSDVDGPRAASSREQTPTSSAAALKAARKRISANDGGGTPTHLVGVPVFSCPLLGAAMSPLQAAVALDAVLLSKQKRQHLVSLQKAYEATMADRMLTVLSSSKSEELEKSLRYQDSSDMLSTQTVDPTWTPTTSPDIMVGSQATRDALLAWLRSIGVLCPMDFSTANFRSRTPSPKSDHDHGRREAFVGRGGASSHHYDNRPIVKTSAPPPNPIYFAEQEEPRMTNANVNNVGSNQEKNAGNVNESASFTKQDAASKQLSLQLDEDGSFDVDNFLEEEIVDVERTDLHFPNAARAHATLLCLPNSVTPETAHQIGCAVRCFLESRKWIPSSEETTNAAEVQTPTQAENERRVQELELSRGFGFLDKKLG